MKRTGILLRLITLLALVPFMGACASTAETADTTVAAAADDDRRENAQVTAGVSTVLAAAEATFTELGITVTHRNIHENGRDIQLHGRIGDQMVEMEAERHASAAITHVHVTVSRNSVYDRTRANDILQNILRRLPKT